MAFIYALDNTAPADTDLVKDGAAEIREFKNAVIERVNSFFGSVDNNPWQVKSGVTFLGNFTQSAGTAALQAVTATTVIASSNILAGASGILGWNTRASMQSPADGIIALTNAAATDFTRLQFGGTTASFPSLARSTTSIQVRLADNSALTDITALTFTGALVGNASTASSAAQLTTARNINGVSFNGTADITITASTTGTLTFGTHLTSGSASFSGTNATITSDATNLNTVSTIVARDASGNFVAGTPSFTALNVTSGTAALQAITGTTLTTSALYTVSGGLKINGSAATGAGVIMKDGSDGLWIQSITGGTNDLQVVTPAGSSIMRVPTGTANVVWTGGHSGITTLAASGLVTLTGTGQRLLGSGAGTSGQYIELANTGGDAFFGVNSSTGAGLFTGGAAYSTLIGSNNGTALELGSNFTVRLSISNAGAFDFKSNPLSGITTVSASGAYSSTVNGLSFTNTTAGTGPRYISLQNTSGGTFIGVEDSAGGNILAGSTAYATILNSFVNKPVQIGVNNTLIATFSVTGIAMNTLALSGVTTIATSSTINSQTISASANFTGSVTVASGFTVSAGTSAVQALTATSGVFTSFVKISATQLLYFDGGGDTYMSESSANVLNIIVGGADVFAMSGTVARFSLIDLRIDSAKKFYLDGGGDTYIHESSANTMTLVVGGANAFSTTAVAATFVGDFSVPTTKKMYLDGGSNTYITESSADTITAVTGATNSLVLTSTTAVFIGSIKTATVAGSAGAWKLGVARSAANVADTLITVNVDGTNYDLLAHT